MKNLFHELAAEGARFPVGTDLVLRSKPDHAEILLDGSRLGKVCVEAADLYDCPIALPLMDLMVEKVDLLTTTMGLSLEVSETHHLDFTPSVAVIDQASQAHSYAPRLQANLDAIRWIAEDRRKIPCGMVIGPFSLTTKLLANPIEPVYMAGMGMTGEDDEEIALLEGTHALAMAEIERSVQAQVEAGAKIMFIAEPAANVAFFSPNQIEAGSTIFDQLVSKPNAKIVDYLHSKGVQVIFHCCGELIPAFLTEFCSLRPEMISLGSSRDLVVDAGLVPQDIVLYGNLPSKRFYSDQLCPVEEVVELARKLVSDMKQTSHPFILGSECDVLSVPGAEETIRAKVAAMLQA
ncbi:MAG: hypothetical protein MUC92_06315 [Fimbriimonadaceae bacterium]|jgi:uroporphyrinogen-III decarboxylase|nr:hypothetical protein [Fimbriimonadaceae bacterium]